MDEFRTEQANYTPNDFILWKEKELIEITPKFQRRPVWRTPARSFFIDTILRGMTVPPLYFRLSQNKPKTKTVREVVDGQQRVRSVLDFVAGEYRLSKTLQGGWGGQKFDQLTEDQQSQILNFSFPTQIFKGISDQQILEVFCRLNTNGIGLNKQELRNGKFFGIFKQLCYQIAFDYLEFWRKHRIFTEQSIARMLEVELTSELLIAGNKGMQDKKTSITEYYQKWDNQYADKPRDDKRFRETMNTISEIFYDDTLVHTDFRRAPLFYTLYCVVFHHTFGLPGVSRQSPKKRIDEDGKDGLREAVVELSDAIMDSKDPSSDVPPKYKGFVLACQRQTDNIQPRKIRFDTLFDAAF
jgi:hypothetical protein